MENSLKPAELSGNFTKPSGLRARTGGDSEGAHMITSKLTAKAQTTIPQAVRLHLGLKEGDLLGFAIEGERVVLCKPMIRNLAQTSPVLAEWESEADQRAYYGL
jgi:antitoxin PrlF